jgi:hypothetical protein
MKNLKDKVDLLANLSIITVAVLLCVVLVKSYVLQPPVEKSSAPSETWKGTKRGDPITLPGIDWQKNRRTLLFALSTSCHFCTQSGPFYQRIVKERGDIRLVALVPQAEEVGRIYLKSIGVAIDDVRQASLNSLGLSGTPTLILVDSSGSVTDVWVGALSPRKEDEVISRLRTERASKRGSDREDRHAV